MIENPGNNVWVAHWLMKSEPEELSIDDLARSKRKRFQWDGVRNYRARNWMLQMQHGEQFFFAHSSCKVPGIAGIAEIVGDVVSRPHAVRSDEPLLRPCVTARQASLGMPRCAISSSGFPPCSPSPGFGSMPISSGRSTCCRRPTVSA